MTGTDLISRALSALTFYDRKKRKVHLSLTEAVRAIQKYQVTGEHPFTTRIPAKSSGYAGKKTRATMSKRVS